MYNLTRQSLSFSLYILLLSFAAWSMVFLLPVTSIIHIVQAQDQQGFQKYFWFSEVHSLEKNMLPIFFLTKKVINRRIGRTMSLLKFVATENLFTFCFQTHDILPCTPWRSIGWLFWI